MISKLNIEKSIWLASASILLLALILIVASPLRINHDAAIYLLLGQLLLEGNIPYVDYVEVNFPLIHYLNVIPAGIAQFLGVNPIPVFQLMVFLLTITSIWFIHHLLKRYRGDIEIRHLSACIGLGIALVTFMLVYRNDYGQREHLFMLLFLPGLVLRWLRWNHAHPDGRLAFVAGLMAGLGASIKPHFLLAPLALEAYWLLLHRRLQPLFTPEATGFVLFGVLYAAYFVLMPRELLSSLLMHIKNLQASYSNVFSSGRTIRSLIQQSAIFIPIALAPFIVATDRLPHLWGFLKSLGIALLASVVIFVIQRVGGAYYLIPALMIAMILIVTGLLNFSPLAHLAKPESEGQRMDVPLTWRLSQVAMLITLLTLFLYGIPFQIIFPLGLYPFPRDKLTQAYLQFSDPGDRALVITADTPDYVPMLKTGRRMTPSYVSANPLLFADPDIQTALAAEPDTITASPEVSAFLDLLQQEILRWEPALFTVVDIDKTRCSGCPYSYSLYQYLQAIGFIPDVLNPTYQFVGEYDQRYVYQRVGEPTTLMEGPIYLDDNLSLIAWEIAEGSTTVSQCGSLTLKTWWEPSHQVETYYSMTAVLTNGGNGVANADGTIGGIETIHWATGKRRADQRTLSIPCDLPAGEYPLLLGLYTVNTVDSALVPVTYEDGTLIGNYFYLTTISLLENSQ